MARRSPNNPRYQKYTEPKGQTRRSAAAAKPVRKEGSGASAKAKAKTNPAMQPGGKYYEPDIPEYKFWRRIWWICLGSGLLLVGVSFWLQYQLKGVAWARTAGVITLAVCYALIIGAFLVDYRKLRPMRKGTAVTKPKSDKGEKNTADKPGSDE